MLSHSHNWFCAVCLLIFSGFSSDELVSNSPQTTYRKSVFEVRVTFFATDEHNRPVEKIGKDDFAVVDSGIVVRDFRSLIRTEETALDVVAIVDVSESVAPHVQNTISDVQQLVAGSPSSGGENISVMAFAGSQPALICARNCGSEAVNQKLTAVKAAGATPLFDALVDGARFISEHPAAAARPVVILFSDGVDTISRSTPHEAVNALVSSGAVLYAVDLNKPQTYNSGSGFLQQIAAATGGRYFPSKECAVHVLQTALDDLRASYAVSYQLPSQAVGYHTLRIFPKHNLNLRFYCRNGYYYEGNAQ